MRFDAHCTQFTFTQLKKIKCVFKSNEVYLNLNSIHGMTSSDEQNNPN